MTYETHYMDWLNCCPEDTMVGFGVAADRVVFRPRPLDDCWGHSTERHTHEANERTGWGCSTQCPRKGDFSATVGLCPDHYREIVGER